MAVPPKFAGTKLQLVPSPASPSAAVPPSPHTLEIYLDYCCPFSARMFHRLTTEVFPMLRSDPASPAANNLVFVFRQQVQPWHPSSTLMHEAALAVLHLAPEKFWAFSAELFRVQREYFDVSVVNETRNHTYRRLAKVAAGVGLDEDKVFKLLKIPDRPVDPKDDEASLNIGNGVTNDLKFVTRQNRQVGVHVTPTVVLNGVVQNDISSGWTLEQTVETDTEWTTAEIAETLLIYHAGTGRITFLAMLKVTSLFVGAFFCLIVGPSYIKADKPPSEIAGVLSCGLIPLLFTAYTTAPFATHIHIHLPPSARASPLALRTFVASALPPSTELSITTMSPIAKPRYSRMRAGDLRPARQRFGIVNYVRPTDPANEGRKWYNLGAVNKFCVTPPRHGGGPGSLAGPEVKGRAGAKRGRDLTEAWIWDALRERIARREAANKLA
ncbi:hypothetical protein ESCO_005100 [Escovopsis weberi]|uniref:Thioredoxin-like fold domain-containing protein n=1 Tax=Escovopsis weberi TaxID=150374 RepID=A0A0M9VVY8_ESCWE|nr:hypothetical protein ESCO_005100 [Escovopsis weberi]